MADQQRVSSTKQLAVFFGIGIAIFLVGAVIGCFRGISGDEGSNKQAIEWAVKTGFLLLIMSAVLGSFGSYLTTKLNLPPILGWAILMAAAFAIMDGGGVLLGIGEGDLIPELLGGLLKGTIIGAITGLFFHRKQAKIAKQSQPEPTQDDPNSDAQE